MQLAVALAATLSILVVQAADSVADDDDGWRVTTDTLFYSDTDNVVVVSPQIAVHRSLDEDGGSVSARVVVDAVSAASVDVVSQATNRFSEVREEVDLGVSKAFGKLLPSLHYRYSHEPDYDSHGLGFGVQRDLKSSDTTLALSYNLSLDTVGYTGTPSRAFSEALTTHGVVVSLTQVLGPKTLLRAVYNLTVQEGYLEKPYRFVPLFDAAGISAARADGVTINLSNFDRYRLALRPAEEVPGLRIGHAAAIRLMRYIDGLPGALRLDYQFFADSWGVLGHTLEPAISWQRSESQLLSAYARLYAQQSANFWRREYVVTAGQVPRYRTLDRDLSDYATVTGGLRFEWTAESLSAYVDGSAMETMYRDYLFLERRLALVAQVGLRWQF